MLSLAHNQLDSAKGLERLFGLKELDLGHNLIIDANGVAYLSSLPLLTDLWLEGNPLAYEKVVFTSNTSQTNKQTSEFCFLFYKGYFISIYSFFGEFKNKLVIDDRLPTAEELPLIEEARRFVVPLPKRVFTEQV